MEALDHSVESGFSSDFTSSDVNIDRLYKPKEVPIVKRKRGRPFGTFKTEADGPNIKILAKRYGIKGARTYDDFILKLRGGTETKQISGESLVGDLDLFDFSSYSKKLLWIVTAKGDMVLLNLNSVQQKLLGIMQEEYKRCGKIHLVILKARQQGISTMLCGFLQHCSVTRPYFRGLQLSHEDGSTVELFKKIRLMYDRLPPDLKPMTRHSTIKQILLENPRSGKSYDKPGLQSQIIVQTAGSRYIGVSQTYHAVHISEWAKMDRGPEHLVGLGPAMASAWFLVYEYTAKGFNHGYDLWRSSISGDSGLRPVFFSFLDFPEYRLKMDEGIRLGWKPWNDKLDEAERYLADFCGADEEQLYWRRTIGMKACQGNANLFLSEYPATPEQAFVATGRMVFPVDGLKRQEDICRSKKDLVRRGDLMVNIIPHGGKRYNFKENHIGLLEIVEEPLEGFSYCLGVDSAEGREISSYENDYGVVAILRRGMSEKMAKQLHVNLDSFICVGSALKPALVGLWRGKLPPIEFAGIVSDLGWWYNNGWVNAENNAVGAGVCDALISIYNYRRILGEFSYASGQERMTGNFGFRTVGRGASKQILISQFVRALCGGIDSESKESYDSALDIYMERLLVEGHTFINRDGRMEADAGKHDDVVMAVALAWFCHLKAPWSMPGNMRINLTHHIDSVYHPMCELTGY